MNINFGNYDSKMNFNVNVEYNLFLYLFNNAYI